MGDINNVTTEDILNQLTSNNLAKVFENYSENDLENKLAVYINELIDNDFNRLVNLLYRIDINEEKLKSALKNEDKNDSSGKTIAKLILERQLQKLKFREQFSKKNISP